MYIKMTHTIDPANSPGTWHDSVLKLYLKGEHHLVAKVEAAIRDAIANAPPKPAEAGKEKK